jgi:hypothetical protein
MAGRGPRDISNQISEIRNNTEITEVAEIAEKKEQPLAICAKVNGWQPTKED